MGITGVAVVLLVGTLGGLAADDSSFQLTDGAAGRCLGPNLFSCYDLRWTTVGRLMDVQPKKCLGAQGKSVGSGVSLYDCDETNELQQWECRNETLLALKGQELYMKRAEGNTIVLSRTVGPSNHLTISGTTLGACSRTHRKYYTIDGNAAGRPCMFPFLYKDQWYGQCTTADHSDKRLWCAVETKFEHELWGYCPSTSKETWHEDTTTGAKYQFNTHSALTWSQAQTSCQQQGASLLSITDPHEQAYIAAVLGAGGGLQAYKLWTGLTLSLDHGWQWADRSPFRYLNWDSGHPASNPGFHCGIIDGAVGYKWQTSSCNKLLGYICYTEGVLAPPTEVAEAGFCSAPWIPYRGRCFQLVRGQKTWSDAQKACHKEEGDLASIHNVEDQSFVISQLGYASDDELWIGLNDKKREGLFEWSDHSTVRFTSWEHGKPSTGAEEDCVLIKGENGNWADSVCSEKHGYICMKHSATTASGEEVEQNIGCKAGWRRYGSYCYFIGTETKTFEEAKNDCQSSHSYLADVSTGVDNAFLVTLVGLRSEKHFWLGLSNQNNIDSFEWTTSNTVKFTHWNAQMPGSHQGCVAMATGNFAGLWDVLPCTNKEKYICKHLAEGAVLTPVPPTVPGPQCADGWTNLHSRKCFKAYLGFSNLKTWYEAKDYCRAIGGDLLSIHNPLEQRMLPDHYRRMWIGLSAPDSINGFVWSDGSPVNFQHWDEGEPNNKNGVESCVEFSPYRSHRVGSWNDVQCDKINNWICQITAGVTPKPTPEPATPDYNMTADGWLQWRGSQYFISDVYLPMEEARQFCQKRHSDLASIHSQAESIFLWKQILPLFGDCWIGLTVDFDGTYQWMDKSQVTFQRWDEGQPDFRHYDENCVVMRANNGFWHDYNCGYEFKAICKRSESPHPNTTAEPPAPVEGGCLLPWKKVNSKCYSVISQQMTWGKARETCKSQGGNLATISSRHVEVFLLSLLVDQPRTDVWIGLHNLHGYFSWTDGQPKKYLNFALRDFMWRIKHEQTKDNRLKQTGNCFVMNTSPLFGVGKLMSRSCNDTNGFICMRDIDPALANSPEPASPDTYVRILNDSVKFVPKLMNWEEASRNCEADGAHLVSIRNEWIQAFVELQGLNLKGPVWIGLNKIKTGGYFRYCNGRRLSFSLWGTQEPTKNKPCVYTDVDGRWKTAHCNETMSSVCLLSTERPPTESPDFPGVCPEDPDKVHDANSPFWIPFRGHCYIFFTELKDWPDASTTCAQHEGALASIEDPTEQEFIHQNVKMYADVHRAFWMGLYKTHREEWLWLDRTVMDYTNWADGQPDEDSYGEITTTNGTWKAGRAWHMRPYICKAAKVTPPTLPTSQQVGSSPKSRTHVVLAPVVVLAAIVLGVIATYLVCRTGGNRLPIPNKLTTFDNPLFFSMAQSQPDSLDDSQQEENVTESDTEPIINK